MLIEKGNRSHIDEIEALYNDLNDYFASSVNYPGWIKHIYPIRETASNGINEGSLYIAGINGSIAGSIILNNTPENAYAKAKWLIDSEYKDILVLRTLVVYPLFMKKKVAVSLMEFARQFALEQNLKSIRLDVSVDNIPAIALYEKMGYQYIDTVDLELPYKHLKWFRLYELVL